MTTTVFVSGATGYIAQHIVNNLLQSKYKVIGSVRSTEKGEGLKKSFNDPNFSYEVVKSIGDSHAFDSALEKHPEVEVFLHTASPATVEKDNFEQNVLMPAINGTKNVLSAIEAHGKNVKNVVITSSVTALVNLRKPITSKVNENSWNDITWEEALKDGLSAYAGSKTYAEKAAWLFMDEHKPQFSLTTVNPVYVFGPQLFDANAKGTLNVTSEMILAPLRLKEGDPFPPTMGSFVDVRDAAKAHCIAFENPDAAGKRILVDSDTFNFQRILNVYNDKFPGKVAVKGDPEKTTMPGFLDNTASRKILGFQPIDFETCVYDSVKQYLANN